jgi:hypothetical protein
MFPSRSKAAESILCGGLALAILSICLRIDSCTNLRGKFGTKLGHGTLELAQKTGEFILFLWLAIVVGVLVLFCTLVLLTLSVMRLVLSGVALL